MTTRDTAPSVAVLMPVYNAREYAGEAIQSILDQAFTDFEFIIINDGSTDGSDEVISSFNDPRIEYITICNRGIAGALNEGIHNSTAPLIARMDADDVSLPERLAKQFQFLQEHPEIGLVGTWARVMEVDGSPRGDLRHPTSNGQLQFGLMFHTPFVHPSVMFRRALLDQTGLYDTRPGILEDYDLWSRMAPHTQLANIPEDLLAYRAVPTGFSHVTSDMDKRVVRQRMLNWKAVMPELTDRELDLAAHMEMRHSKVELKELRRMKELLRNLVDRYAGNERDRRILDVRARSALMGFHVIEHRSFIHRLLDHAIKRIAIALPL